MIDLAVILAVGRGTRLGPLTKDRPRAMLPVLGKPVAVRIMDRLKEAGISRFIVVTGEHEGAVVAYLNTSWTPDVKPTFVLQIEPRGIAHALSLAAPHINAPFVLASTDHLTSTAHVQQLLKRFEEFKGDMVLSVTPISGGEAERGAVVRSDGTRVTTITQETLGGRGHMAFLLHACSPRLLKALNGKTSAAPDDRDLIHPIKALLEANGKITYVNAEWHVGLVHELDLLAMNKRLLREGRDAHILSEIPGSVHIIPPVRIDPQVSIGLNAKIGPNVYLESGASVGEEAVVWDSVVLRDAAVLAGEVLHNQIVARRARLSEEMPPELPSDAY